MKRLPLLLLGILLIGSCTPSQPTSENQSPLQQPIDSLFAAFDTLASPGYAIAIEKKGEIVFKNGYGAANLDYDIPITTESTFSLASVSKQFTAACVALLILDDKLSLESDVSEYLPELKKYPDTLRLKHLIYNTSGIKDYNRIDRESGSSWVTFNYFEIDECIRASLSEPALQFTPGSRWDYSNMNFILLTKIVEAVSGLPFAEFAKTRLFEPLGMQHTFIHDDITTIVKNRVTPYNPRNELYVREYGKQGFHLGATGDFIQHHRNAPHYGGSGVMSTIDDLLLWTANMSTHAFGGSPFYDLMHKTLSFEHGRNNQAFGLYFSEYQGRKTVAWEGSDYGISTQILRFPEQGVSIIVLSNLGSGQAPQQADAIADVLIAEGILE